MYTEISHEEVTKQYDELVEATSIHANIAHENVTIEGALKTEKAYALANGIIEGSNADKRDAAWREHYSGHLILFDILQTAEREAKLRQTVAQIRVEELRLHARIAEGSQMMEQYSKEVNITLPNNLEYDTPGMARAESADRLR